MITFLCLSCGGILKVDAGLAGRIGQCSHCGHWMQVPHFSADSQPEIRKYLRSFGLVCSLSAVLLLGIGGVVGFAVGRLGNARWEPSPALVQSLVPGESPPVALAEWQDVSQTACQGPIEVALEKAEVRYVAILRDYVPSMKTSDQTLPPEENEDLWKHKELVLCIRIQNAGTQPFHYAHPGREEIKLIDDHGNLFRQTYENATRIKGQLPPTVIVPGQAVEDVLVFSCSYVGKGNQLLLELPAQHFGGKPKDRIKLKMDQKLVAK